MAISDKHDFQFEPSWVERALDKTTAGYVGIYVNADFSMEFSRNNNEWIIK